MSSPRDWLRNLKKHRAAFFFWVFVLLSVLVIVGGPRRTSADEDGSEEVSVWTRWKGEVAGVALIGVVVYLWREGRRAAQFGAENEAALEYYRRGDYEGARVKFAALASQGSGKRHWNRVALLNLASTEQSLGDFAAARVHLLSAEAECKPVASGSVYTLVSCRLALVEALAGRLEEVGRLVEESQRRAAKEHTNMGVIRAHEAAAQAVLDCRKGAPERAVALLDARWRELDSSVSGDLLRPLRVVRAFAIEAASGGRDAQTVVAILSPLRECQDRQLAHLGDSWPEMRAFLLRHGIT